MRRAGPLTTVQDLGRPGFADLGVPAAGAADPRSARLANRLVGNDERAAVLEVTLGGLELDVRPPGLRRRAAAPQAPVTVDGGGGRGGQRLPGERRGAGWRSGPPTAGCAATSPYAAGSTSRRCSAAAPPTRSPGSARHRCATGTGCRSATGRAGSGGAARDRPHAAGAGRRRTAGDPRPARRPAHRATAGTAVRDGWTVTSTSDRTGLRLDGPALEHASAVRTAQRGHGRRGDAGARRTGSRSCSSPTTRPPAAIRWSAWWCPRTCRWPARRGRGRCCASARSRYRNSDERARRNNRRPSLEVLSCVDIHPAHRWREPLPLLTAEPALQPTRGEVAPLPGPGALASVPRGQGGDGLGPERSAVVRGRCFREVVGGVRAAAWGAVHPEAGHATG